MIHISGLQRVKCQKKGEETSVSSKILVLGILIDGFQSVKANGSQTIQVNKQSFWTAPNEEMLDLQVKGTES